MYNHQDIEAKWQKKWLQDDLYKTAEDKKRDKYYVLDMFPYPSGVGLHVGHPRGYIATDVLACYKRLNGFNVLHPMGWDAFGLPAENYALANKVHPKISTDKNIVNYKRQLNLLGLGYDWSREINTTDPAYYKWTQWAFIKMFAKGLVYESHEPINWCPTCLTGLANEDVEDGRCERCDTLVEKRPMRQWVIKITDYAERLLNDLDKLPDWEDPIKAMQRNWIGRSEGAEVAFAVIPAEAGIQTVIEVFTTRPDTIFGATYLVVCPEHKLITNYELRITNLKEVQKYINQVKNKSDLERTDLNKDKTGVQLKGIKAINPATNEEITIWVADYVLPNYGTGAIMAVPAHDSRDYDFAIKYQLPIKQVVSSPVIPAKAGIQKDGKIDKGLDPGLRRDDIVGAYEGEGVNINSDKFDGLKTKEATEKIIKWLEKGKIGQRKIQYKLKDWVFSRQRYWGEPIPLIFCENCQSKVKSQKLKVNNKGEELNPGWFADENLPVKLPEVESYEPSGTGESPLANIKEWVNTICPKCGGPAKRETNTMPQWAGSSWYYLAYIMKGITKNNPFCHSDEPAGEEESLQGANKDEAISPSGRNDKKITLSLNNYKKAFDKWLPVDFYVGGAEHATRHLIYARFWHKFLQDIGVVAGDEPFIKYRHVGLILAEDNRKMSKRWNNVINPDDIIVSHGADALRVYEMFMGPFGEAIAWNTNGLSGARKFLDRVYALKLKVKVAPSPKHTPASGHHSPSSVQELRAGEQEGNNYLNLLHKTIRKVGEDIENFKFNTAVSALMILVNKMTESEAVASSDWEKFLVILAPFAPHLAEELWVEQKGSSSIFNQPWPKFDPKQALDKVINLVVQINGKLRDTIEAPADISEEEAKAMALKSDKIIKWLDGKKPAKIIYVKGRLVNIVV